MQQTSSLREKKSAKIKLAILAACKELLGKNSFNELYVDEICEEARISKVTFFKYFPQKDDVLLYYMRIWCLERAIELHQQPKEGVSGIYYLFDKLAETLDRSPGFFLNLISYYTGLKRPPSPFPLKLVEKKLLFPQVDNIGDIEIYSIQQMLEKFLLEAIFNREVTTRSDPGALSNLFLTVFYGAAVTAHLRQVDSNQLFFRNHIDSLLRGLN